MNLPESRTSCRRLAIISDTHLPTGRRDLPAACVSRMKQADLIVHAGDFTSMSMHERLRILGPPVAAVRGNADSAELRSALPERLELALADGVRIGIVHDAGRSGGRLPRLRSAFQTCAAVIFGHSHIPLLEHDPGSGFQIFNPGSPTDKRRQPRYTMGWAEITADGIGFELIAL